MATTITSAHNPHLKALLKLAKRSERTARAVTAVEGVREAARALACGHTPVEAYVCPDLVEGAEARSVVAQLEALDRAHDIRLFYLGAGLFAKIAVRGEGGGIVLAVPCRPRSLADLPLGSPPFLALIEGAEKPGNLGAILRTADAAGVDGVIVCAAPGQAATDLCNPNVVRASLGTFFSVRAAACSTGDAVAWLHAHGIALVAASPAAPLRYTEVDLSGPAAIALGSEADGLSAPLLAAADLQVSIPMHGSADSLNLATSAALLLYEVVRQRAAGRLPQFERKHSQ